MHECPVCSPTSAVCSASCPRTQALCLQRAQQSFPEIWSYWSFQWVQIGTTGQEEIPCSDELNGHLINWNHVSRDSERRRIQNGELYWGKPQWGKGPTAKATCLTPWHFLMDITLLTDCRSTPWEQVQTMPSCICYNAKTFPLIFVVIFEQVNMPLSLQAGKS